GDDDVLAHGWTAFADVLLQRAALVSRLARDRAPDPLAGFKIDDEDVDALLSELPGLEPGDNVSALAIEQQLAGRGQAQLHAFLDALAGGGAFAAIVANAGLDELEAAVFAVLAAIELDPRRQRLVAYLNDDVALPRATPFSLGELFRGLGPNGPHVARL